MAFIIPLSLFLLISEVMRKLFIYFYYKVLGYHQLAVWIRTLYLEVNSIYCQMLQNIVYQLLSGLRKMDALIQNLCIALLVILKSNVYVDLFMLFYYLICKNTPHNILLLLWLGLLLWRKEIVNVIFFRYFIFLYSLLLFILYRVYKNRLYRLYRRRIHIANKNV